MTVAVSSGKNARIAIISGASSGIGRQFAIDLDGDVRLDEIWLCARREERLQELAASLRKPARVLAGDITDKKWRDRLLLEIKDSECQIHKIGRAHV